MIGAIQDSINGGRPFASIVGFKILTKEDPKDSTKQEHYITGVLSKYSVGIQNDKFLTDESDPNSLKILEETTNDTKFLLAKIDLGSVVKRLYLNSDGSLSEKW